MSLRNVFGAGGAFGGMSNRNGFAFQSADSDDEDDESQNSAMFQFRRKGVTQTEQRVQQELQKQQQRDESSSSEEEEEDDDDDEHFNDERKPKGKEDDNEEEEDDGEQTSPFTNSAGSNPWGRDPENQQQQQQHQRVAKESFQDENDGTSRTLERERRKLYWILGTCGCLLLVLVVVTISLLLTVAGVGSSPNRSHGHHAADPASPPPPTLAPTLPVPPTSTVRPPPAFVTNPGLYDLIVSHSSDQGQSLSRVGSPQRAAYLWLQNKDELTHPPDRQRQALSSHRILQRYRLVAFYIGTNGPTDWIRRDFWQSGTTSECEWYGVTCRGGGGGGGGGETETSEEAVVVIGLELVQNNVTGILVPEVGDLTSLEVLIVDNSGSSNGLIGVLPPSLRELLHLDTIVVRGNDFGMQIELHKDMFHLWTMARHVDLSNNQLPGPIPHSVDKLKQVISLNLAANYFNGAVPSGLQQILTLQELNLSHNLLTGSLPSSFLSSPDWLFDMTTLDLSFNRLSGKVLFDMTESAAQLGETANLRYLDLSHNQFTGTLPVNLFDVLVDLQTLLLHDNPHLLGSLPPMTASKAIQNFNLQQLPELNGRIPQFPVCNRILGNRNNSQYWALVDCLGTTKDCDDSILICCSCCTCQNHSHGP